MAPPTPLYIVDRRLTIIPQSVWGYNKCSELLSYYVKLPVQLFSPSSLSSIADHPAKPVSGHVSGGQPILDRRPDHRERRSRHLPGRRIRRPDHRPLFPGSSRGIRAGRSSPEPPLRPTFDQLSTKPREPSRGLLNELPMNCQNCQNRPKRAKTGINRRFRRISDPITLGFGGITSGFWGIASGFWGITSGFFAPQIQLKAFKTRGPIFHFWPFQIRIRAVHPIL